MSLSKIDLVGHVNESQPLPSLIKEICQKLRDTQLKLMQVNNECLQLRQELNELKRKQ